MVSFYLPLHRIKKSVIQSVEKYVKSLRNLRVLHRWLGIGLAVFLLISASTGFLLGWKKESALLQPPTQKGVSKDLIESLPIADLASIAQDRLATHLGGSEVSIDRMDFRPSKGMVKVLFEQGYWEVQLDAKTGETLSIARRHSDWIEALHDGSIVGQWFKLLSMNVLGIGLLILIVAGIWLWYGPKVIRARKRH